MCVQLDGTAKGIDGTGTPQNGMEVASVEAGTCLDGTKEQLAEIIFPQKRSKYPWGAQYSQYLQVVLRQF